MQTIDMLNSASAMHGTMKCTLGYGAVHAKRKSELGEGECVVSCFIHALVARKAHMGQSKAPG